MDIELRILQADHGDSIIVSVAHDGGIKNILIDGGPSQAFEIQNIIPGPVKLALDDIKRKDQNVDLLILTHVDDDHIGGLLAGFNKYGYLTEITKEVWFNSGKVIFNHFDRKIDESNIIPLRNSSGSNTSTGQGVTLEDQLTDKDIWSHSLIKVGDEIDRFGCKFKILSPSLQQLEKLLIKWEKDNSNPNTTAHVNDYQDSFEQLLIEDKFTEDKSIHNGSSLAFIFELDEKSLLLLGDAHPSVVIESMKSLGYSEQHPLRIDYVKVSHHGSKANTNNELLKLIECNNFIISTNGNYHGLPNKQALARIINRFPTSNLMFNYPDLIKKIFTEKELKEATFSTSSCEDIITL
jgi:beta-lactamase superfamily II metal-dependent hydrolase